MTARAFPVPRSSEKEKPEYNRLQNGRFFLYYEHDEENERYRNRKLYQQ